MNESTSRSEMTKTMLISVEVNLLLVLLAKYLVLFTDLLSNGYSSYAIEQLFG